jgi:hypothetical protein
MLLAVLAISLEKQDSRELEEESLRVSNITKSVKRAHLRMQLEE